MEVLLQLYKLTWNSVKSLKQKSLYYEDNKKISEPFIITYNYMAITYVATCLI